MNEILKKISSYNILNYLFPGAAFSIIADRLELIKSPEDVVTQLLWYYFIGMVISRVGSVILEPVLRKSSFVKYSDYSKYLHASSSDPKLEIMVEASNTYRTLTTAFLLLLLSMISNLTLDTIGIPNDWKERGAILLLGALFLFSFKKQSNFVTKRVNHHGG